MRGITCAPIRWLSLRPVGADSAPGDVCDWRGARWMYQHDRPEFGARVHMDASETSNATENRRLGVGKNVAADDDVGRWLRLWG